MQRQAIVLAIFVLSGAAGLVYEIVWSRQLVLVFGNTSQAVSAILTGFFGGMAIGGAIGGRLADRVRSPLRLYGLIELALVGIVLATPVTFDLLHEVYRGAYGELSGSPQLLTLVRLVLALLAMGPATVLMGATLPALTRHLTSEGHLSAAFGRLYAANTFGAIAGTLVAGLVLIELLGLSGALVVGATCSGVAGLLAVLLARDPARSASGSARVEAPVAGAEQAPDVGHCVCLGSHLPRLSGAVDASPRLRDRQLDVRIHPHPRRVPVRDCGRRRDLQHVPASHWGPDPAARGCPGARGRARARRAVAPGRRIAPA
jgi:spermidine synthase